MGELGPERLLLVIMQCMPCEVKEAASRTPSCTEKRSVKKDARRSVVPRFMVGSFSSKPFGRGRLRVGHHAAKRTTSSRGTGQEKPNTKASTSPEVISLRVGLKTRMLKMYFIMHSRHCEDGVGSSARGRRAEAELGSGQVPHHFAVPPKPRAADTKGVRKHASQRLNCTNTGQQ